MRETIFNVVPNTVDLCLITLQLCANTCFAIFSMKLSSHSYFADAGLDGSFMVNRINPNKRTCSNKQSLPFFPKIL